MITFRARLLQIGMMSLGYGMGQLHPTDWTGIPWWGNGALGVALCTIAIVLECRRR